MLMESSRRPFDRSREPGLKKPRLTDDPIGLDRSSNGGGRSSSFIQRPTNSSSSLGSRFRTGGEIGGDSESSNNNSVVRGAYPPQTQQQHQEIVNQYKAALAELTINSKPIITNLTIIAGEYLHAAKAIAATICGNIIEVPSDQKLPSLYLLDSIVKNIGRDYIKYFAVRLPEVFCKVYNQADPAIHPGMRHLFGTWKGVFPLQSLQAIEKELGFTSAANGSSSGTTSRSDASVPRPAHSIHVNPKYLEARRLQQSTRGKGASSDISGSLVNSPNHLERLERTPSISSGGACLDPSVKSVQRPREQLSGSVLGKRVTVAYGDSEYDSDIPTRSGLASGGAGDKFKEDKLWFDSESVTGRVSNQNNGFDVKHGFQSYPSPRSLNPATSIKPTNNFNGNIGMTESWKNSEEEEYMWEDINSRLTDHGTANISGRDHWTPDDSERMSEASADSLPTEMKSQATFGSQLSSSWSKEPSLLEGIRHPLRARYLSGYSENYPTSLSTGSVIGRTSFQSKTGPGNIGTPGYGLSTNATLGSGVATRQLRHALGGASPSAQLPTHQRPSSPSFTLTTNQVPQHLPELDKPKARSRADPRISHFSESLNVDPGTKFNQDLLQLPSRNSMLANQRLHSPDIQNPSSVTPLQLEVPVSFTGQREPEPLVSELSRHLQKPLLPQTRGSSVGTNSTIPDDANPLSMLSSGQSGTRSLLAAVMNSGILGGNPVTGSLPQLSSQESIAVTSKASKQPLLPSGPPTQFTAAGVNTTTSLSSQPSHKSTSGNTMLSQRNVERPPLPPGPSPSSLIGSTSTESSNVTSVSTPVSSLLSTLVAKGLISASKAEPPATITDKAPARPVNQAPKIANSSSIQVSTASVSVPLSSLNKASEFPAKSVSKSPTLPQSVGADMKNQIGFDFKPDVLRESHPPVIKELLDDLPHKCSICGLRLKVEDRLARHLEWHDSRNQIKNNLNKASREWYAHSNDWIAEGGGSLSCDMSSEDISEGPSKQLECDEPMVPADENQCLCILCGELFDDFYDQETDQWMFRGAVYSPVPCADVKPSGNDAIARDSIVHAICIATS